MIFRSVEDIDHVREKLVPAVHDTWINKEPYKYYNHWNNQALNENNEMTKWCSEVLYDIFLKRVEQIFKSYTIYEENDPTVYSYVSNKDFTRGDWHNHVNWGSIAGVFYMKCVEGCGIEFRDKGIYRYIQPKENELYIFPSDLDHFPHPSKTSELRISCNMNLKCKEPISVLFDPKNIRENFL